MATHCTITITIRVPRWRMTLAKGMGAATPLLPAASRSRAVEALAAWVARGLRIAPLGR